MNTRPASRAIVASTLAALALFASEGAHANLLVNGDFDAPLAPNWTLSPVGSSAGGLTEIAPFDTTGGGASSAVRNQVGSGLGLPGGKRFSQTFDVTSAGLYAIGVDIASQFVASTGTSQLDGGTYVLAVDGTPLASFVVGVLSAGQVVRKHLFGDLALSLGSHVFALDLTRTASIPGSNTFLYFDNAVVDAIRVGAVPEPAMVALMFLGLGAIGWRRRVRGRDI